MANAPRQHRFLSLGPNGFHRIAYTEWGNPRNEHIVVCVHGLTRNSRDFDALGAARADRCRVVCMDVAGRGNSDWLVRKEDYGFPLYRSDAAALIAHVTHPGTQGGGLFAALWTCGRCGMQCAARRSCCAGRNPSCSCRAPSSRCASATRAQVAEFTGVGHAPWLMSADQIGVVRDFILAPEPDAAPARAF